MSSMSGGTAFEKLPYVILSFIFGLLLRDPIWVLAGQERIVGAGPTLAATDSQSKDVSNYRTCTRTTETSFVSDHSTGDEFAGDGEDSGAADLSMQGPVDDVITDIASLLGAKHGHSQLNRDVVALQARIIADPAARRRVLDRIASETGNPLAKLLQAVISSSSDPEVADYATRLAHDGATLAQKLSGVEMLGQLTHRNAGTQESLVDILKSDGMIDDELAINALAALTKRGGMTSRSMEKLVAAVQPYVMHSNPRVREQGLKSLAEWAPQQKSVVQTVTAATEDQDVSVRIAALESLGQNAFAFSDVREAILARLQDPNEDPQVQLAAWQALDSFPMDDTSYRAYKTFESDHPELINPAG